MNPLLKRGLHAVLPRSAIQALRRWHAPRVAKRFKDVDWPYAEAVRAVVQAGDTVIDVGANMGYITARLADYVGANGRVIAIEPVPDTFALLEATVRRLRLNCVEPINAAASSASGQVAMEIPEDSGGENLYESRIIRPNVSVSHRQLNVPAFRLDDLLASEPPVPGRHPLKGPVSFIKIDVEGHELEVIHGAQSLITQHHPALLIEVTGDPDDLGSTAHDLFEKLNQYGYRAYQFTSQGLALRRAGDKQIDYWFF